MAFEEHNNRKKADKFAEYITGQALRKYVANKVKKYVGDNPTVFDGAVGSGQLEQYVEPSFLYGVDIQKDAIISCKNNFPNSDVKVESFMTYDSDVVADCVIMNPPFSLKLKYLSELEIECIQKEFSWKKSGNIDDIFLLKSLKHTKRYAFYIMFPGIGYRSTEQRMRELIGNKIVELNLITNGFEDTNTSVLFIVIDKEKEDDVASREIYDCKLETAILEDTWKINFNQWEQPRIEITKEKIDIDAINLGLNDTVLNNVKNHLEMHLLIETIFKYDTQYLVFVGNMQNMLEDYKNRFLNMKNEKEQLKEESI